jgi:hypothetical protein
VPGVPSPLDNGGSNAQSVAPSRSRRRHVNER